ncbi:MAG: hypothetical protein CMF01_03330 [Hyphomonas sp.]|nr:hypothetical protein [Hyphomonas sp.]MBB39096.1 hypothetical protein [Hyphomonas sp.]
MTPTKLPPGLPGRFTQSKVFDGRRTLLDKADTEEFPDQKALPEKSARTLVVQLLKRHRDIRYMKLQGRKPPSVLIATLAMQSSGNVQPMLIDELIAVAEALIAALRSNLNVNGKLVVENPFWKEDLISDRWNGPDDVAQYQNSLVQLVSDMQKLKLEQRLSERKDILRRNFGEDVSVRVLKSLEEHRSNQRILGATAVNSTGGIIAAAASQVRAETKKTHYGGET